MRNGRIGKLKEIYAYRDSGDIFWPKRFGPAQPVPEGHDWDLYLGPARDRGGAARCVPALAAQLTDVQLSQSARYALEPMSSPAVGRALVAALDHTTGLTKGGIVSSLGVRREKSAVSALGKALADSGSFSSSTATRASARKSPSGSSVIRRVRALWLATRRACLSSTAERKPRPRPVPLGLGRSGWFICPGGTFGIALPSTLNEAVSTHRRQPRRFFEGAQRS